MKIRGILPTNRPDDIPYEQWRGLLLGQLEAFNRAMARFWLLFVRLTRKPWPNVARALRWWARGY